MYYFISIFIFLSGAAWGLAFLGSPALVPSIKLEFGQLFQMVGALATLAAAVAAWKAARHSEAQGAVILEQQHWQKRQAHYKEFSDFIADLENHYEVRFYQPLRLYVAMFPNSRKEGSEFNLECDLNYIENIRLRWEALLLKVILGVDQINCGMWMAEVNKVAISLKMDISGNGAQKSYEFQGMPTGFTSENYAKIDYIITNCLDLFSMFCGLPAVTIPPVPPEFHKKLMIEIHAEREWTS